MESKLSLTQRLELIRAYKNGEKVNDLCRKFRISRVLFYRLLKRHNSSNNPKTALMPKKAQVWRYARQLPPRIEQKILSQVAEFPEKSVGRLHRLLGLQLGISRHAIQNVLLRHDLNTLDKRIQLAGEKKDFLRRNPSGLSPQDRLTMIEMVKSGKTISEVCRKFGVSRVIFYRIRKRFEESGGDFAALEDRERQVERFARQAPPEVEEKVKQVVASRPQLSSHKISAALATEHEVQLGNHGVHNVLKRLDLNTVDKRVLFAQGYIAPAPRVKVAPLYQPVMPMYRLRMLLAPFVTVPKLLLTKPKKGIWYLVFSILPLVIFALWTRLLLTAPSDTSLLGLIFASIALFFGLFFFLYSMKYYLTILIVLRLASSGQGQEDQESKSQSGRVNPLLVNLEKVELTKRPFVSIHVAIYNEEKVIKRLIQACTSQAWTTDNSQLTIDKKQQGQRSNVKGQMSNYEVVIVDDSTDETTEIAKQTLIDADWKLISAEEELELFVFSKQGSPTVKLLHRASREGFKGGALQRALENTDPRAEYICVFDADFVPYPDTIEQFVKTFQVLQAGQASSGNGNEARIVRGESVTLEHDNRQTLNETGLVTDNRNPTIAAVQGYQWHVLNKSENWITRGVRTEYAGSYVIERSGGEIYQGLKQIAGAVYCIRADVLRAFGWGTSITEDFELTLRLYEAGYKVAFTPYIQAPAEAVSTVRRLIRQRMRWAEGASFNVKVMLSRMLFGKWEGIASSGNGNEARIVRGKSLTLEHDNRQTLNETGLVTDNRNPSTKMWIPSKLSLAEKLEFAYLSPYYLQAAFLVVGTISWFLSEAIFHTKLPFWTAAFGWSLVFTNLLSLPLMNIIGLFLEESDERDYLGIFSFVVLSYIMVPFCAYAAIKGFLEAEEGPWFRTPKTGLITDVARRVRFFRFNLWPFGKPSSALAVDGTLITADSSRFALSLPGAYKNFSLSYVKNYVRDSRRPRFISRGVLASLVVISILFGYLSYFVPPVSASPGLLFANSTYSGNGTSQSITDVGFQPEVVIIKGGANHTVWTSSAMSADATAYFTDNLANFAGGITGLVSGGFTVGSDVTVNASGTTYHYIAMADSANDEMQVGSYAGDGNDDRNITVGFIPMMVFIKADAAQVAIWRPASLTGDNSHTFRNVGTTGANLIQNLTGASLDGFQVGADVRVNGSGNTYYWVALKGKQSSFSNGNYTGNDWDDRNITDPTHDVQMVWIKGRDKTADNESIRAVFRTDAHSDDSSEVFPNAASAANRIQGFVTNGFQVGTADEVNDGPDGSGSVTYDWVAWSTSLVPEYFVALIPFAPFLPKLVSAIKRRIKKRREARTKWRPI